MKTDVISPLMGSISMIFAEEGAIVAEGDKLLAVECMKMQYDIEAPADGRLVLKVELGDIVGQDDLLAVIVQD